MQCISASFYILLEGNEIDTSYVSRFVPSDTDVGVCNPINKESPHVTKNAFESKFVQVMCQKVTRVII